MGGDADANSTVPQRLELKQVLGDALLTEPLDPAARISRIEQDEADPGLVGGLRGRERLLEAEVVELADGGVTGAELLAIDLDVVRTDLSRCQTRGHVQHGLAPGPEVAALRPTSQRALERVAMGVHESRNREPLGHLRIISAWPLALCPLRWQRFRTS